MRSSLHFSQRASCLAGSKIFSTLAEKTPPASVMRTSDFSVFPSSSMVFHRPAGVAWASAPGGRPSAAPASASAIRERCIAWPPLQNRDSSIAISEAGPERAVRISAAVSGSSLAK